MKVITRLGLILNWLKFITLILQGLSEMEIQKPKSIMVWGILVLDDT